MPLHLTRGVLAAFALAGGCHGGGAADITSYDGDPTDDGSSDGSPSTSGDSLPVVPGGYGFGMQTRAAYGGEVPPTIHVVQNLDDHGPGSLRAAFEATGPRVIVFEVSGTIRLESDLVIRDPYVTVAGQTAPSPGILIRDYGIWIDTHDVLVQHLRVRPGWNPDVQNCNLGILAGYPGPDDHNIVLDHMSVSWTAGKTYTFGDYYPSFRDITMWRSISAEGLYQPYSEWNNDGQQDKCGSSLPSAAYGMLLVHVKNVSILQSVFKDHAERNPFAAGSTTLFFANNVIHNFRQGTSLAGPWPSGPGMATIVGNVHRSDEAVNDNGLVMAFNPEPDMAQVYMEGNRKDLKIPGAVVPDFMSWVWDEARCGGYCISEIQPLATRPIDLPDYPVMSADQAYDLVLASAGARPVDRAIELVDQGIINDIRESQDFRYVPAGDNVRGIPEEYPHGGYPQLVENHRTPAVPADPHSDDDADGYTNLEEWLHAEAAAVE